MTTSPRSVVIIGGGIIGTASAYYLSRAGWQVRILERGAFGKGCSHANCGLVSPSHVLPLAGPGAIREALGALVRRNGPFAIKPRFDLDLWMWLFRFARRCNTSDMLATGHAIQALLNSSRRLYDELMKVEALDCEWETHGLLFVFQARHALDHYGEVNDLLSSTFAMPAERIDGDALLTLEPTLKPGLAGAWFYRGDAHLRPDRLIASWRRVLEQRGVAIEENCEVRDFVREGRQVRALRTTQGDIPADAFVVATGAWTPLLNEQLGCRIPIQPGKGYSITMARPAHCPKYPLLFEETRVVVTPFRSGYRLGSTMEFAGYDGTINRQRLELLRAGARPFLHEPYCEPVEEEWFGWRPMTWDSLPILDYSPTADNLLIAAGHNMLGISMAPATGLLVSELLSGAKPHLHVTPYRVGRF